jgi:hypothetical protein
MYPFKIRIKDPELIEVYKRLEHDRIVEISNSSLSRQIGWDLKPIRKDIFIGLDSRYKNPHIALKPRVTLEMIPLNEEKTVFNLMFKKLF